MLQFENDYCAAAHPEVLQRLAALGMNKYQGYGCDELSASAGQRIAAACGLNPGQAQQIFLLCGGTQTNQVVISALLHPVQGVLAVDTGHISLHEAGAVEASGHKVLQLPGVNGKMQASALRTFMENFAADLNRDHMVQPGAVYISQPTEYGTLYTLAELSELRRVCDEFALSLYVDGARLAYALGSPRNDVTLSDLARLCDAFYIGGTKCGTLFGEAVVFPRQTPRFFFTAVKQHGALLAKGFVTGAMFEALFTGDLYLRIGREASALAASLSADLAARGVPLFYPTESNQIFVVLDPKLQARVQGRAELSFWERLDAEHTVYRIAVSWATSREEAQALAALF